MMILTYQHVEDGAPEIARMLEATLRETTSPVPTHPDHLEDAVATPRKLGERLLAADEAPTTRHRPGSHPKTVPVRLGLAEAGDLPQPTIRATLRNDGPSVRPTDLHDVPLAHADDGATLPDPRNLRRVVQGRLTEAGLHEALSGEFVPPDPSPVAVAR